MDDVSENIDDYNSNRKRKILIVFDDMIADIMTNNKFHAKMEELFERCRKLSISLVFIAQSCFAFFERCLIKFCLGWDLIIKNAGIKHYNDLNAFIKCSNTMDDVYENINDYNPIRKRKKLIAFDDMIADIMTNRTFQAITK